MKIFPFLLTLALFSLPAWSKQMLQAKNDNTYMYKTKAGQKKFAVLSKGEHMYLLQKGDNFTKVKADGDVVGWVLNSNLEYIPPESANSYKFQEMVVHGWLDNPTALYILDHENIDAEAFLLTRDFQYEIFEFIDRETIERANDEN